MARLDAKHPSVAYLNRQPGHYASGRLEVIRVPPHYDFVELRRTPAELREHFQSLGWSRIVAFQTRNPLHRAHEELTKRAAEQIGGGLLIHPVVGVTKPGDVDHYTRVRCYRALVDNYYEPGTVVLSLLPLAMRMAGPREVLLHAIIRRNYGCTHFIVGRDHAGPGNDSTGKPFYSPYAAQESMGKHEDEIGMQMVDFKQMVYLPDEDRYSPVDEVPAGAKTADISGTEVRDKYLAKGLQLPEWFSRPAVAEILNETNPPKFRQGMTIWFTGLSGSGKSTIAHATIERLAEFGRNCSLLDGDEIRTHLSKGLGFSKEDRDTNIRRVGYVAGLVAQHGGTTLCSVISPYRGHPRRGPQDVQGQLRRGLLRHPDRGLRAARRQGHVRQGPRGGRRRQADGLHRRRRSLRAAARTPRSRSTPASSRSRSASTTSSTSCWSSATSCPTGILSSEKGGWELVHCACGRLGKGPSPRPSPRGRGREIVLPRTSAAHYSGLVRRRRRRRAPGARRPCFR